MSVCIMYSLYNRWCDKILDKSKPLEFRTRLPKQLSIGSKVYLYETKRFGGSGAVVGECTVKNIINILSANGKWPCCGSYPFLEYYYDNIAHKPDVAEKYRSVKTEFLNGFTQYKHGFIVDFAFSDEQLQNIRTTGHPIDTWKIHDIQFVRKILDDMERSRKYIQECDQWLTEIGFYNEMDESNYRYALELDNVYRYNEPISVINFKNFKGEYLKTAPQSYCYVQNVSI